jgi:hypothetical protein
MCNSSTYCDHLQQSVAIFLFRPLSSARRGCWRSPSADKGAPPRPPTVTPSAFLVPAKAVYATRAPAFPCAALRQTGNRRPGARCAGCGGFPFDAGSRAAVKTGAGTRKNAVALPVVTPLERRRPARGRTPPPAAGEIGGVLPHFSRVPPQQHDYRSEMYIKLYITDCTTWHECGI